MKILTPFDLQPKIDLLKKMAEGNHYDSLVVARLRREKFALYEEVLSEISNGRCPDPKTLATVALQLRDL